MYRLGLLYAACQHQVMSYDSHIQRLDEALQQLAHTSGCPIQVDLGAYAARPAPAVKGRFLPEEVLWRLLKGSGLDVSQREQQAIQA
jgi:hypothetical protein